MTLRTGYAPGEFCWVDLASHGFDAAAEFYESVFGWTRMIQDTGGGPPYALFLEEGSVVAGLGELTEEMRGQGVPAMWNLYAAVADVGAAAARAADLGGQVVVPPMPVMDAGKLAFVAGPEGALLGLWEAGARAGAERIEEIGTHCWTELRMRDLAGAKAFHRALLGWDYADHAQAPQQGYAVIEVAASGEGGPRQIGGLMVMGADWGDAPAHWSVYFQVDDVEQRVERLRAAGGKVLSEPFDTPVGPLAVVADLHGAVFQLIQPHHSAA